MMRVELEISVPESLRTLSGEEFARPTLLALAASFAALDAELPHGAVVHRITVEADDA